MLNVLSILCLLCHMGMLSVKISVLRKSFHSLVASHEGKDDGAWYLNNPFIVYNSFQSCKGKKWFEGPGSIMSDSSRCHHEQSRCHSSNNTLYTDLFSSDKWTRAVSKSQSWIKPLSPKPLFFIFPIYFFICWLRSQSPTPWLGSPILLIDWLEWFNCFMDCFWENPSRGHWSNLFNLHAYLNKRYTQTVEIF